MGDEKKSVTIRLDEPELIEWVASQSSAVASIRMAVKMCILQYGRNVDLLDAILRAQFGHERQVSENLSVEKPKKEVESIPAEKETVQDNITSVAKETMEVPQLQQAVPMNPSMQYGQETMNIGMEASLLNQQMAQNLAMNQNPQMNQTMGIPNPAMQTPPMPANNLSASLSSLL